MSDHKDSNLKEFNVPINPGHEILYFLSFQSLNNPGLGAGFDPGMVLTPYPSSIG